MCFTCNYSFCIDYINKTKVRLLPQVEEEVSDATCPFIHCHEDNVTGRLRLNIHFGGRRCRGLYVQTSLHYAHYYYSIIQVGNET